MLPLAEAMMCEVPAIVPNHTALSEWPKGVVEYINLAEIGGIPLVVSTTNGLNTRHYTPDPNHAVERLQALYKNPKRRRELGKLGRDLVLKNHNWDNVAQQFVNVFEGNI
jgi:glycosyltransferase involved in cell wall biosynthesis